MDVSESLLKAAEWPQAELAAPEREKKKHSFLNAILTAEAPHSHHICDKEERKQGAIMG